MTKIILIVVFSFVAVIACGQTILQNHFKGNKDSLEKEAYKLINLPDPIFKPSQATQIDMEVLKDMGFEQVYKSDVHYFTVRDGKKIFAYKYPMQSENTVIIVHGVASSAYLYNKTAGLLQAATQAEVFAIDLRGHGQSEGKHGDVDYINQYVDDLLDIIKTIRQEKPKGKIIIAGHSMGGGIALNYNLLRDKTAIDGIILFAPLLGHNSPALAKTPTTEDNSSEPFMKIHFARLIGLKMLNEIGNHSYDSLNVLFFNLPENSPVRKYTYRANMSMTPEDYVAGLKAIHIPTLVLIGSKDEAFDAESTKKAVNEYSKAHIEVITGANHNSIRHLPQVYELIKTWCLGLVSK